MKKPLGVNLEYNIATFPNLKLNFWAITKCGSTTMKHILLRADNPSLFKKYDGRRSGSAHWAHGKCKYITPNQAKQNGFKNFTILRDPIQRLGSMYNSLERLGNDMDGGDDFKKDIKTFFKNPNVSDFVDLLGRHKDEERNIHFRSQSRYCSCDGIMKFNLSTISSSICQLHPSLKVDIELNKTAREHTFDDGIIYKIHQVFKEDFVLWSTT